MELTVTLKIQVDDDKVFNTLPEDMQETILKEVELDKKWADAHVNHVYSMRSTYISRCAQDHFGGLFSSKLRSSPVVNKSAHKELGIDLNEGEIQIQKFREDK